MKKYISLSLLIFFIFSCQSPETRKFSSSDSKYRLGSLESMHHKELGSQVYIFNPSMAMEEIQILMDSVYNLQKGKAGEFSDERFAFFFMPGIYKLDIKLGYYTQVCGLGTLPGDVVIEGSISSLSASGQHVLTNFWRSLENLTVIPSDTAMLWGVSQASPIRRVHVKGNLRLFDRGYASGGFMADCKIDGEVYFGSQQQWFSRNCDWESQSGGAWNIFSLGVNGARVTGWPEDPYINLAHTPRHMEKPVLVYKEGGYYVQLSPQRTNTSGISWEEKQVQNNHIPLEDFYIVTPQNDDAVTINKALQKGHNLLFTPGIYKLTESLHVTEAETIILGLGLPSLQAMKGNKCLSVEASDGIIISGLLFDAGADISDCLLEVGTGRAQNQVKPSWLFDVFCRVGGTGLGKVSSCVIINSDDVIVDHMWLWRADHGKGVAWDENTSEHGLIVNGDRVTIYGLFNEHHRNYQTVWNGDDGKVFLYQSEMPYDPPQQQDWMNDTVLGFASYKIADKVTRHQAWGVGVYSFFRDAPIQVSKAIESPLDLEDSIHYKFAVWLNGNDLSSIKHIINQAGNEVNSEVRRAVLK